jgi:hypothetical protein
MKKTSKNIAGGILAVMLIGTIGAVVASAHPGVFSELTDDQKEEIYDLKQELKDAGATREEIKETMRAQLEEYGVELPTREEILEKQIEHTKQKLEILERTKELIQENPDITKEEIREIIEEEFDIDLPENGKGMKYRNKGRCGPYGPKGFKPSEETE